MKQFIRLRLGWWIMLTSIGGPARQRASRRVSTPQTRVSAPRGRLATKGSATDEPCVQAARKVSVGGAFHDRAAVEESGHSVGGAEEAEAGVVGQDVTQWHVPSC